MNHTKWSFAPALVAASLVLGGCYETATPVIGPGVELPIAPGTYRCRNAQDGDGEVVAVAAPGRIGAGDVVYLVTVDKDRYAVRAAALSAELFALEARGADLRGAGHVFVRRVGADGFDLMAANAKARDRLTALARTHGVAIAFGNFGTPSIDGPPDRLRAFLLAHTADVLERTSSCRRAP